VVSIDRIVEAPLVEIDVNTDERRKSTLIPEDFEQSISDVIGLVGDGV
jgi:hypothetical protein